MKGKTQKCDSIMPPSGDGIITECPAHFPFANAIEYCVRGTTNSALKNPFLGDHGAQIFELVLDDLEPFFWWEDSADAAGLAARQLLSALKDRIKSGKDQAAAEVLWAIATEACTEILALYLRNRALFDRIASRRKILPAFFSIHPETAPVMAQMRADSKLGEATNNARQIGSKPFFVSDRPANVYARAIITSVLFNSAIPDLATQQASYAALEREEGIRTRLQPAPKYFARIQKFPRTFNASNVMKYWRLGKEIILEEMPNFHTRPEWQDHRERHYAGGAKVGAIQHAIFKDILAALKTMAGASKPKHLKKKLGKR